MRKTFLATLLTFCLTIQLFAQWTLLNSGTTQHLYGINFPTSQTGYAVGANGTIVKTNDAGANWTVLISGTTNALNDIFCTNDSTCYAVGNGSTFLKTTDGGKSWSTRNAGSNTYYTKVAFFNDTTGIAIGAGVFLTTDSAHTWTKVLGLTSTYYGYNTLSFVNDTLGYITSEFNGRLFKTINRGKTWTEVTSSIYNPVYCSFFPNDSIGYIGGDYGKLLKTTDSGKNWTTPGKPTSYDIKAIYFIDESIGFAMSKKPFVSSPIHRTNDGGKTWSDEQSDIVISDLYAVTVTPDKTGFTAGAGGKILKRKIINSAVNELNKDDIKIFPNPTSGFIQIVGLENYTNVSIKILSLDGKLVKLIKTNGLANQIDVSELINGFYLINLIANNTETKRKFLKTN